MHYAGFREGAETKKKEKKKKKGKKIQMIPVCSPG
jgi:hypothetical protein